MFLNILFRLIISQKSVTFAPDFKAPKKQNAITAPSYNRKSPN